MVGAVAELALEAALYERGTLQALARRALVTDAIYGTTVTSTATTAATADNTALTAGSADGDHLKNTGIVFQQNAPHARREIRIKYTLNKNAVIPDILLYIGDRMPYCIYCTLGNINNNQ